MQNNQTQAYYAFNIAKDNKATEEDIEHYRKRDRGGIDIAGKSKNNIPINRCMHCQPCFWYKDRRKCPAQKRKYSGRE